MLKIIKDHFLGKILDFIFETTIGKSIIISFFIFIGSLISSNPFINLFIQKKYFDIFIISAVFVLIFTTIICLSYLFLNKLNNKKKYNEKKLIKFKLNFNKKIETINKKINLKDYFDELDLDIYYKETLHKVNFNSIVFDPESFIEINFKPFFKEKKIIENYIYSQLQYLNYNSNKDKIMDIFINEKIFHDQMYYILENDINNIIKSKQDSSTKEIITLIVIDKIKDEMLKNIYSEDFLKTSINNLELFLDLNVFSLESEILIKFYFKGVVVDSYFTKLKNIISEIDNGPEFKKEIFLRNF